MVWSYTFTPNRIRKSIGCEYLMIDQFQRITQTSPLAFLPSQNHRPGVFALSLLF